MVNPLYMALLELPLMIIGGVNIALSYLYSGVYNRSKSIFLCIIIHAFTNGFWDVYRPDNRILPALPVLVLSLIVFRLLIGKNIKIQAEEIS